MNATKRKFNTLLSGIGNKSATSLPPKEVNNSTQPVPSTDEDTHSKKRRISDQTSPEIQRVSTIRVTGPKSSAEPLIHKKSTSVATASLSAEPPKYAPWDRPAFLNRLKSFSNLTDWTPKPERVNEVEWAKRGWVCQKFERVRCCLCNVEILVKLNRKEVDGKEEPVLIARNIEDALVDRYAELIITSHEENCLWRKRGCDDTIFKLPLTHPPTTLQMLRQRYDELCTRSNNLPYLFNLDTPPDFDLQLVLSFLPKDFFSESPTLLTKDQPSTATVNEVALTMALFGWQGHTHVRLGSQPGSVSCSACFRVLGLWLFKSKQVNEAGEETEAAVVPGLNLITEHRNYCPWRNAESQNGLKATASVSTPVLAGWEVILRVLKNDHRLRAGGAKSPAPKEKAPPTVADESPLPRDSNDDEDARSIREEKDKERWARLRRVKSLFETKEKRLQRTSVAEKRKSRT